MQSYSHVLLDKRCKKKRMYKCYILNIYICIICTCKLHLHIPGVKDKRPLKEKKKNRRLKRKNAESLNDGHLSIPEIIGMKELPLPKLL